MEYIQAMREIYSRLDGKMATTLKKYRELKETYSRLDSEFKALKQEYPKYKPKKVKAQYDKLKLDLIDCRDEINVCGFLLLLGIPLDEFNNVYAQAKSKVLDILSRYENDVVLNVLMAEHTLSAYIRYCKTTKELTYNVALIYIDDKQLPSIKMTDDYVETLIVNYMLMTNTLSELHSKWKKTIPVDANLHRNFQSGTRNYTTIEVPYVILQSIVYYLYDAGDLPMPVFILPEELSEVQYKFIFDKTNLPNK